MSAVDRSLSKDDLRRPLTVLFCVIFVAALQFTYFNMDAPTFRFMGLRIKDLEPVWYLVSFVMAALPSLWMPVKLDRPSQVAYWILYLTVIVPVMWIPLHTLDKRPEDYIVFSGAMLTSFFLLGLSFRLPRWHVPRPKMSDDTFFWVLCVMVAGMSLVLWASNGFSLELGLRTIYDRRRAARESIPMGSALSYVKGNLASAIQPFAFAVGLARKSWVLILLSIFAGVIGFSVDGSKTSAAIPFFLLALYPLITRYRPTFGLIVPVMATVAILSAYLIWYVSHNPWIPVVSTWRIFDVKGLLSGYYWEYFGANGHTYLGDGILKGFSDYPYNYAASQQIGLVYFGSPQTNSNSNLWSSAFGDFGLMGMFLVTAVLGMIFRFVDSLSLNRGFLIPAFLCSFLGMKLSDVALDTSILSHGTLMVLVLLFFLPPQRDASAPEQEPVRIPRGVPA